MNIGNCMRCLSFLVVLFVTTTVLSTEEDNASARTWTSKTGKTVVAALEKVRFGNAYLQKEDGQVVIIRVSSLSKEDQEIIKELTPTTSAKLMRAKKGTKTQKEKAPDVLYELFGSTLRNAKKKSMSTDELAGKTIGIYFSAHWCPPCRAFTPKLVDFYNSLKKQDKPFEIVFVSSDHDKKAMYNYMKEMKMPWLALPYGKKQKKHLSARYNVKGIPKLVILSASGDLITGSGRGHVMSSGAIAFDKWQSGK